MQDCSIAAPCSPHAVDGEASSESMSEAFSESMVTPKAFSAVLLLMRVLLPRKGFSRQLADFAVPAHFPRTPPHPASNMVLPSRQHTRIFFLQPPGLPALHRMATLGLCGEPACSHAGTTRNRRARWDGTRLLGGGHANWQERRPAAGTGSREPLACVMQRTRCSCLLPQMARELRSTAAKMGLRCKLFVQWAHDTHEDKRPGRSQQPRRRH